MFGKEKTTDGKSSAKETEKQSKKKVRQSRGGSVSCVCALLALSILAGCIAWAYAKRGEAGQIIGGLAVLPLPLTIYGLRSAGKGFRERERKYFNCRIGILFNITVLILFAAIFAGGLQ